MTTPLPTLDSSQLARAISLLDEEWLQHDPDLGPVMPLVLGRGVGQDWHKAGTFRHHLIGVTRTLTLWQQPKHVRQLGLLHSVYGNAHVDLMKFDPKSERGRLYAEACVHTAACWGNSWDKRIGWDGWMSWGRVLLQSAQKRQWPETLNKLNNVALTPEL